MSGLLYGTLLAATQKDEMSPSVKFKLLHTDGSEMNVSEPPTQLLRYDSWLGCCENRLIESMVTGWSRVGWPVVRVSGYRLIDNRVAGLSRVWWPVDRESGGRLIKSRMTDCSVVSWPVNREMGAGWSREGCRLFEILVTGWCKVRWPVVRESCDWSRVGWPVDRDSGDRLM